MDSEKQIRIGIIGAGQIANHHMEVYQDIDGAKIVAVTDIKEEKAEEAAAKFGIPQIYRDARKMLDRDDIDAVDVCVHNNLHMPFTVMALEAGKDVYCEKPMAGAYCDAQKMWETARETGQKLSIQLSTLYSNECRAAKKLVDDGQLGDIYHARSAGCRRRGRPYVDGYGSSDFVNKEVSAGGALYDTGVYNISMILYLMGNPDVTKISGKTYQELPMHRQRQKKSGYNVEELGLGFVRFQDGQTLNIIESWAAHIDNFGGSYLLGEKGGIRMDPFRYYSFLSDMEMKAEIDLERAKYRWDNVYENDGLYDSPQHHWISALQGKVELLPTAELALTSMLISEGIYLSQELDREVAAAEVGEESNSTAVSQEQLFKGL